MALLDALRSRDLLIVLDNCEHMVDPLAAMAETLLQKCATVRVLATSREPLRVPGEAIWRVSPLALPPEPGGELQTAHLSGFAAVQLFSARATSAQDGFILTDGNAKAVAQLCRRLDGMPLALELAAACLRGMSVELLAQRLDQRFRLLVQGRRTALARQQTLRATIDWSYQLLDEWERILLARVSVFANGWMLEAAEQICTNGGIRSEDVLGVLLRLVEKSLVVADPAKAGDTSPGRYHLLETVREYARERLEAGREDRRVRGRHAEYLLTLGDDAYRKTSGPEAPKWLAIMGAEHDNLRAALDWSEKADPLLCLRIATAWAPFWLARGHFAEGRQRLSRALAGATAVSVDRARALNQASELAFFHGDNQAASALAEEGLAIAHQLGDVAISAPLLNQLGRAIRQVDHVAAQTWYERSLAVYQQLGDHRGAGAVLCNLGICAAKGGDYPTARSLIDQGNGYVRESGDMRLLTISLLNLGHLDLHDGNHAGALAYFRVGLTIAYERGDLRWVAEGLASFAHLAAAVSQAERSVRLAGAAAARGEALGMIDPRTFTGWWSASITTQAVDRMKKVLGHGLAAKAWDEGRAMDWEQAVTYALRETRGADRKTCVSPGSSHAAV